MQKNGPPPMVEWVTVRTCWTVAHSPKGSWSPCSATKRTLKTKPTFHRIMKTAVIHTTVDSLITHTVWDIENAMDYEEVWVILGTSVQKPLDM